MKRYTFKMLEADLVKINEIQREIGNWRRVIAGQEDGITRVWIATEEQLTRHCTYKCIGGGTPRECLAAVYKELH